MVLGSPRGLPNLHLLGLALPDARLGSGPRNNGAEGGLGSCLWPSCCRGGEELAPGQFIRKEGPALRIFSQEPNLLLRFVKPRAKSGPGLGTAQQDGKPTHGGRAGGDPAKSPRDGTGSHQLVGNGQEPGCRAHKTPGCERFLWAGGIPAAPWPRCLLSLRFSPSAGRRERNKQRCSRLKGGQRLLHHQMRFRAHRHILQGQGSQQAPSPCLCFHLFRLCPFSPAQTPGEHPDRGHHG